MGGRLLTSAFSCLYAGSTKCLTRSFTVTYKPRSSAAPAISRACFHKRPFGNVSCTPKQAGLTGYHSSPLRLLQHRHTGACLPGHAVSSVRSASGVSGSTSQTEALQRKVSHILVKPNQEHILDEVEDRLAAGEDFRMLAGELSECRGSRMQGGLLGWIERGQVAPMFEQAAFEADIGELVRAETQFGLHLIKVEAERHQEGVMQMSVSQLADILQDPEHVSQVQLVDVREEVEERVASLSQFQLKPLSRMRDWGRTVTRDLDPAKHTIVMCHHGMRSQQAAEYLESLGFAQLSNVEGGIHAYSLKVDPTVPMY